MRNILLSLVLLFVAISSAFAQELTVKSFKLAGSDLTAQTQPRKDLNDRNCALIKVGIGLQGVQFEGGIRGNVENKTGEYWVYMPQGIRQLKVKHANYAPVMVTFADYGVEKLESNRTYELIVVTYPQYAITQNVTNLSLDSQQATPQTHPTVSDNTISIPVKDGISIDMARVEAGTFTMGATAEMKELYDDERPTHRVTLTNDYYIGKYEVTQALWQTVMGNNPSKFKGDNLPVEQVKWKDCQKFLSKLNRITGKMFRLPTEDEWEYAARGGNKSRGYQYSGSNNLSDVAWYDNNSGNKTHAVGTKQPNELGIYDMSGNVLEWCQDRYGKYNSSSQVNPTGANSGSDRVFRGGSWISNAGNCRSSYRDYITLGGRDSYLGLRLVLSE
ncbi:MAG: formylglycine-generating enzyme family protein [Prevotella sp.]|nr:formylglycine-generating enzyme family protein [Prevotella sp.]